ncbi:hypothetical protein GGX14DRAFT_459155 [Mycena pura]|uniref:Uncharacterized protein n=1 Tax=Mycena pura TaxID=153505 RepID=A0AAD6V7T1_9AGAR|nr:hypothetical protein GGX14DRAFT_459155 [Mycena pura]
MGMGGCRVCIRGLGLPRVHGASLPVVKRAYSMSCCTGESERPDRSKAPCPPSLQLNPPIARVSCVPRVPLATALRLAVYLARVRHGGAFMPAVLYSGITHRSRAVIMSA